MILAFLFFLMVAVFVFQSEQKGVFRVRGVSITVNLPRASSLPTENETRAIAFKNQARGAEKRYTDFIFKKLAADLAPFEGLNVWQIPMSLISERISQNSWIEGFEISRRLPDDLRIEIRVKEPVVVFLSSKMRAAPIAYDGTILPDAPMNLVPDLPIVRDVRFIKDLATRGRLARVMSAIPASGLLSRATISEVRLDKEKQLWFSIEGSQSLVRLGEEQIPIRVARVTQVLDYLQRNQFKGRQIDADFSKKVLVKLRINP